MKIEATDLYLTDNGACYCGAHLGATARATGRDISGQPIQRLDAESVRAAGLAVESLRCEVPSCGLTLPAPTALRFTEIGYGLPLDIRADGPGSAPCSDYWEVVGECAHGHPIYRDRSDPTNAVDLGCDAFLRVDA